MFTLKSRGLRFLALVFRMSGREKKRKRKEKTEKRRIVEKELLRRAQEENEGKFNKVRSVGNLPDVDLPTCSQPSLVNKAEPALFLLVLSLLPTCRIAA